MPIASSRYSPTVIFATILKQPPHSDPQYSLDGLRQTCGLGGAGALNPLKLGEVPRSATERPNEAAAPYQEHRVLLFREVLLNDSSVNRGSHWFPIYPALPRLGPP